MNQSGAPVYFYKGTKGLVIRTFSGSLFFSVDEGIFALEEIPLHEHASKSFDFKPIQGKPKKRYIPRQTIHGAWLRFCLCEEADPRPRMTGSLNKVWSKNAA
jgi:hypothetical protein